MFTKTLLSILVFVPLSLMGSELCREDLSILTGVTEVPFGAPGRFIKDRSVTLPRYRGNNRGLAASFLIDRVADIGFVAHMQRWRRQLNAADQQSAMSKISEQLIELWKNFPQKRSLNRFEEEDLRQLTNRFNGMESNLVTDGDFLRFTNIIVDVPGHSHDRTILVGAHYDVTNAHGRWNEEVTEYTATPGANDNGTGVVGILELLRRFKENPPPHDVRFVFFDGEEATPFTDGLVGSRAYLKMNAVPDVALVLDMIGGKRKEDSEPFQLSVGYSQLKNVDEIVAPYMEILPVTVGNNPLMLAATDTRPFYEAGAQTLFFGDRTSVEVDSPYHTSRDTVDHIDFENLGVALDISEAIIRNTNLLKRLEWNIDPNQ